MINGQLGKAARNSLLVVVVIAALASLVTPYRIIDAKIRELAAERIGSVGRGAELSPEWQATIAQLKGFVEAERGLEFRHEVPVLVESPGDFEERLAAEAEELGSLESSDSYVALKALHLVDRNLRLDSLEDPLQAGGTLGYYDAWAGLLVVQGQSPTPFVKQVLVHELVHALQDQHFDLDRELNELDESYVAFEALVEGDATRIEQRYLESLPAAEREQAAQEEEAGVPEPPSATPSESIATLSMLSSFSYQVGERFVAELLEAGGPQRLNRAFASPPTTTEQVIHPERFLDLEKPVRVAPPKAEGDIYEEGVWGEMGLLTLLLRNIPQEQAFKATDGWAGDYYVAWRKGGQDCIKMNVATDSPADREELVLALRTWALQQRLVTIEDGRTIKLRSCA